MTSLPIDDRPPTEGDGLDRSALEEPTEQEEQMTQGRDRVEFADSIELNPLSLVGSWFMATDRDPVWHGIVVAEPQAGAYLVARTDSTLRPQEPVSLAEMMAGGWTFYNTEDAMRSAYWAYEAKREE